MFIATLQTKDFKGLPNDIYTFTDPNIISGRNGSGKSSIADAIIFALYGRTRTGHSSTDGLIHEAAESATIAVEFDTGTTVLREESRFYGTRIKLNGEVVDQKTLDESLPPFKTFLSIFLVGYFSQMDESDQRSFILNFGKDIDFKKLFEEYTRKPKLVEDYYLEFKNIDKEYKQFRKVEKHLKETIQDNRSRKTYAEEQIKNLKKPKSKIDVKKLESKLSECDKWEKYESDFAHNNSVNEKMAKLAKSENCLQCGQALDEKNRIKQLKDLKESLVEVIKPKGKQPNRYEIQEKINEASKVNALYDNYEEQILEFEKQKVDADDVIRKAEKEAADYSLIVEALSPKGIRATAARQQIQPIVKAIEKYSGDHLPIKIETLEQLKTKSDLKEVFKIYANEIPYKYLSTGEKKQVDIAIAQAINELDGDSVGCYFIDDAELISEEFTITGQVFKAYVTREDLNIKEG